MKQYSFFGFLAGLCVTVLAQGAHAEQSGAPASTAASTDAPPTGLLLQARVQAAPSLVSLVGGPGFLVGYQGHSFALGMGLGLTRIGISSGNDDSVSGTLLQLSPTLLVDLWHSADGRARANLVGSVGYGRAWLSETSKNSNCVIDPATNVPDCNDKTTTQSVGASMIPASLGIGGDYFIGRNFALGLEMGLQTNFVVGLDSSASNGTTDSIDGGADMETTYGLLRATFILGD